MRHWAGVIIGAALTDWTPDLNDTSPFRLCHHESGSARWTSIVLETRVLFIDENREGDGLRLRKVKAP
jgi:hypothetical protein